MQNYNKLISYKKNYFVGKQRKIQVPKRSGLSHIIIMSVFRTACFVLFFLHKFSLSYYPLSLLFLLAFVKTGYVNELYLGTGNYSCKSLLNTCSMVTFISYVNVSGLCVSVITFFFS